MDCCGYIIRGNDRAILFSADTYINDTIWDMVNSDSSIRVLIIDVSFPSSMSDLARQSKHLTPALLKEEMKKLKRDDLRIYINHLKINYKDTIIEELRDIGFSQESILFGGELINFSGKKSRKTVNPHRDRKGKNAQ